MTDALDRFADSGNGVQGIWVTENGKIGDWFYDDANVGPEPEEQAALIIDSMVVGEIRFENGKVVDKKTGRLIDGFEAPVSKADLTPGYNPYVSFQLVFATGDYAGQLGTYSGTSWGALFAAQKLVLLFRQKKRLFYPICRFRTKARGDINNTIDPHFDVVGWTARSNFAELLGEDVTLLEAPATAPRTIAAPITEPAPKSSFGYAASYTPPTADDLPEIVDCDPTDPDNIDF
jgi:hypothetical protein